MLLDRFLNTFLQNDPSKTTQFFTSIFNSLQDLIYVMEADLENETFTYVFINQRAQSFFHKDQNLIGKTFEEVLPAKQAEHLNGQYLKAVRLNRNISFEDEAISADGSLLIGETILTPLISSDNRVYIIALVRDVTERTEQIEQLKYSKKLLDENEQRLNSLYTENEDPILTLNKEGYILEVNPATEKISGYTGSELVGLHFAELMSKEEADKGLIQLEKAIKGEKVSYDSCIYHKEGDQIFIRIFTIPIFKDSQVISFHVLCKVITTEKLAFKEINQLKAERKSFLNNNNDAISILNPNGKVEYINDRFTELFGYQIEEVIGKLIPIIPDWSIEETKQKLEQIHNGAKFQNTIAKRQRKTGELIDVSITLSPIFDEFGDVKSIYCIYRDVTILKKQEEDLHNSIEELNIVWENTNQSIFFIDSEGEIIKMNPAFEEIFGWKNEDVKRLYLKDIYSDEQLNQLDYFLSELMERDTPISFETKRRCKDGKLIDILATYQPIKKGNKFAVVFYQNITNTKQLIAELAEREERYRSVVENTPEAILIHHAGIITYANESALTLAKAKSREEIIGKSILDFIYPKNREQVIETINHIFKYRKKIETSHMQLLNLERKKMYAEIISAPIPSGGNDSAVIMIRDITTKLRAERQLKNSEERFRIIAEHSKDIIKIINLDEKITYVSPSIEIILGYHIRELIGTTIYTHIHRDDIETVEKVLKQVSDTKEVVTTEVRRIHKEGYAVWLSSDFIPIFNEEDKIVNFMVISEDITERKKREKELAQMAYYDHLSGLPNRRLLEDRLQQAIYTSDRTGKLTAVMILDGDQFKKVNDTYGHLMGDYVIKEMANRIKNSIRKIDIVSRVGGDEFIIVLPELIETQDVEQIAQRVINKINEPIYLEGNMLRISASMGIAIYPTESKDVNQIIAIADEKLYIAKDQGGNSYFLNGFVK